MLLGTHKQTELRCAVGNLQVKDGVVKPDDFVVDTTQTYVKVEGKVDLANERLDIVTRGTEISSPCVLCMPIQMTGPFKKPSVHPKPGPIAAQAAAAVALGAAEPGARDRALPRSRQEAETRTATSSSPRRATRACRRRRKRRSQS